MHHIKIPKKINGYNFRDDNAPSIATVDKKQTKKNKKTLLIITNLLFQGKKDDD